MKIKKVTIKNFRSYKDETSICFDDLTAFVGCNDSGKSSILEALDIFFNEGKGAVKLDKEDINKDSEKQDSDIVITVSFGNLPKTLVLDDSNKTTLKNEYLLDTDDLLQIRKTFKNASTNSTDIKISVIANHPNNPNCSNLLLKKQSDLTKQIDTLGISCRNKRKNAEMRTAIWKHFGNDLQLSPTEIEVSSKDGDIKLIWNKLKPYLPYYSLFQADRKNSDSDEEIQDPLKIAVKKILAENSLQEKLREIADSVQQKLQQVADSTLEKLKAINSDIAKSLHPKINFDNLKWSDVFKNVSISGDNDIPINKRGSGARRLVLISFFSAEAERRQKEQNNSGIIYAIEEPETSQHAAYQKILMDALLKLSKKANTQIIITTHNSNIVKTLDFENIRLITNNKQGKKEIKNVEPQILPKKSLNEVNYLVFGDISGSYHDELYGYLQRKAIEESPENGKEEKFDSWLEKNGCPKTKSWIRLNNGKPKIPQDCTLQTYIRNRIHHPENTLNEAFSKDDIETSIKEMIEIAKKLQEHKDGH